MNDIAPEIIRLGLFHSCVERIFPRSVFAQAFIRDMVVQKAAVPTKRPKKTLFPHIYVLTSMSVYEVQKFLLHCLRQALISG